MLHAERRGAGDPLVLLHGFTQSGRAWGRAGDLLARRHEVLALDAPGHGRSSAVDVGLEEGADLMAGTVAALGYGAPAWLGYSMGGRFALHVALLHPGAVGRLVLVSATAGIDDPAERAARRRSDEILAQRVEREGVEPFVRWWLTQPIFASLPPEAAEMENRLDGTAAGLASSLRLAGTGTQEPRWDSLGALDMPVLVVAGGLDRKYCDLGERLTSCIGDNATLRVVDGAGHSCHLEQPEAFVAVVAAWLADTAG